MSGLGSLQYEGGLLTEMSDGSIVVGATRQHAHTLIVALHRVNASCEPVTSFGTNGVATLALDAKAGPVEVIAGDPDGGLILGGSSGHRELVGRLLGDGRLDDSFGQDGWARIDSGERPHGFPVYADVTSIAFGSTGSILLGGNNGAGHCCIRSFVTELTKSGAPVMSFGNGGTVFVPQFAYVTETETCCHGVIA